MKRTAVILILIIISGCGSSGYISSGILERLALYNSSLLGEAGAPAVKSSREYINFTLAENSPAPAEVKRFVKEAVQIYFNPDSASFLTAFYFEEERTIVMDLAHTPFIDSVEIYGESEDIPSLAYFVHKYVFY